MNEQIEEKLWFCIPRKTGIIVDRNLRPVPIKVRKSPLAITARYILIDYQLIAIDNLHDNLLFTERKVVKVLLITLQRSS